MGEYITHTSGKKGMPPGSLVYVGISPPLTSKVTLHVYDNQTSNNIECYDLKVIQQSLTDGKTVWIDITGLGDTSLMKQLCSELNINAMTMEDVLNTHQRIKIDKVDPYLLIVFKSIIASKQYDKFDIEQVSLLMKENLLITFRETDRNDLSAIRQVLDTHSFAERTIHTEYLAYIIMDDIVDNYFSFVEQLTDKLDKMEIVLITNPEKISLHELYTIGRFSTKLHDIVGPLCDLLQRMLEDPQHKISDDFNLFYSDLHDHTLRLLETIDSNAEMISSMLDIYLSSVNNRMSGTMKILTVFASIFIPLSFIAGLYGMNFDFMPGIHSEYGFLLCVVSMLLTAGVLLYFFRRKKII